MIFSLPVSWRRSQNIPIYSLDDYSIHIRMRNIHQSMRIAALLSMVPVTPPNIGFCAFNSLSADSPGFGVLLVLDVDRLTKILKLTGVLDKIFKYTVFIRGKSQWTGM